MSAGPRFLLYVKAASDGENVGDCPFSQRVMMYAGLKVPNKELEIKPVDLSNKPEDFLRLNPEAKVPVLIDRTKDNKIISDSAEITRYLHEQFPDLDCQQDYSGPALDACSGVFPKLAALIKNKDPSQTDILRQNLLSELKKVDTYLGSADHKGKFLLGDRLCEIDCMFLPKLRHVMVAGKQYGGLEIPDEFKHLKEYISNAEQNEIYIKTNCPDSEIIHGWKKHTQ
ncbi:chloride intracellular channel protein 6-like [Saccostrea cucullata]|uniref:chloride intracellular channel protein 6-like n=1 Tax=Saccostrea cuccullata TaxID=36930 RepID=UPI002ED048E7